MRPSPKSPGNFPGIGWLARLLILACLLTMATGCGESRKLTVSIAALTAELDGLNAELKGLAEEHELVSQNLNAARLRLSAADGGGLNPAKSDERKRKLEGEVAHLTEKRGKLQAELESVRAAYAGFRAQNP